MRISILTTPGCLVARNKSVTGVLIDVGAEAREDLEMREKQETTQKKLLLPIRRVAVRRLLPL